MHAFIVRPFGVKQGIDFDRVERELILPALEELGIRGGTTAEIVEQGNIRADMFSKLLTADLVVADLSIHNANVFYELGIRHALRDKRTFLIRHRADEVPFDLKTDRYFSYDAERPGESVGKLVAAIQATVRSLEADSPVFQLLPDLEAHDPARFLVVPLDFQEEVELALKAKDRAALQRLAVEVEGLEWQVGGLRKIGLAQLDLRDFEGARATWEEVRRDAPHDTQANLKLGTVYQRLDDLTRSSQAVERALGNPGLSGWDRAEARALQGSNEKTLWEAEWRDAGEADQRQVAALRSPHLERSLDGYRLGFAEDRNHYYSGLNALAMVTVITELAGQHQEVWAEGYDTDPEAEVALEGHRHLREDLAAAVRLSLESALGRLGRADRVEQTEDTEIWVRVSEADLVSLTALKPARVAHAYRRALAPAADFVWAAARKQLALLEKVGVRPEHMGAGREAIDEKLNPEVPTSTEAPAQSRVLLFTGHRVDAPDRGTPRFPAAAEPVAREWILEAVRSEKAAAEEAGERLLGVSGGASGGDILFHEVCEELGVATRMYLAIPKGDYVRASVADGGPGWVERFNRLAHKLDPRVLSDSAELTRWLQAKKGYSIWSRSNLWMLHEALVESGGNLTLIALWNGQAGDGPGGTADMVQRARDHGAKVVILDARELISSNEVAP